MVKHVTQAYWGMKLVAMYIAENVDPVTQNNIGKTEMIWLNSECHDDISNCGVGPSVQYNIHNYFNFAQNLSSINEQLNGQGRSVMAGTFRYVRMEFCKYGTGGQPNIMFQAPGMASPFATSQNTCGITTQATDPIVVKRGDTVRLNLDFSLNNLVAHFATNTGNQMCDSNNYCTGFPNFTPSASLV